MVLFCHKFVYCSLRYIENTFVVWSHERAKLEQFLDHLIFQYPRKKFTMEIKRTSNTLSGPNLAIRFNVNPFPRTGSYFYGLSNHHSRMLTERARRICKPEYPGQKLDRLKY